MLPSFHLTDKMDDIRPDLTEDDTEIEDYRSVDTADILDDDFPDLSVEELARYKRDGSSDSASADMVNLSTR